MSTTTPPTGDLRVVVGYDGSPPASRALDAAAEERLRGREASWGFHRRQGMIVDELIAVANDIRDADANDIVAIVVGSSSHAMHRVVGSVAVTLARHSPVPLVIVP